MELEQKISDHRGRWRGSALTEDKFKAYARGKLKQGPE